MTNNLVEEFYKEKEALENARRYVNVVMKKMVCDRNGDYIKVYVEKDKYIGISAEIAEDVLARVYKELNNLSFYPLIKKTIEENMRYLRRQIGDDFGIKGGVQK